MKRRIELTRGEVDLIVRKHLVAVGTLPEGFDFITAKDVVAADDPMKRARSLAILPVSEGFVAPKDTAWENWTAYCIEWFEKVPE